MSDTSTSPALDHKLNRLCLLEGSEPSFFALAVYSFIEGYVRDLLDPEDIYRSVSFPDMIDLYRDRKATSDPTLCKGRDLLSAICVAHDATNNVRHRFGELTVPEAKAAIELLFGFLCLEGKSTSPVLGKLRGSRDAWLESRSKAQLAREIAAIGYEALSAKKDLAARTAEVEELRRIRSEREALAATVVAYETELRALKSASKEKEARYKEARQGKFDAERRLRELARELESRKAADQYIESRKRLLGLSRSRKEYERFILKLGAEQRDVLDRIKLGSDFLIKGPAGTGKTLVLIKAIEKARGEGTLGMESGEGETMILTFTKTLVKYDEYLSRLASEDRGAHRIQTADSFIEGLLKLVDPGCRIEYDNGAKYAKELAGRHNGTVLNDDELAAELTHFIYPNDVSREEYLELGIERRGMGKPLGKEDRAAAWESLVAIEEEMEASKVFLKGYATRRVLGSLGELRDRAEFPKLEYVFIDEVQDLSAADLRLIKACARRCIVMAGDEDQAIYRPGFSFARAGIDIVGRSRSLGRNFRNSSPILELAERFRSTIPGRESEYAPDSDRPGDEPELFVSEDKEELLALLVKRIALFREEYRYEAENLFVIAPRNADVSAIKERLTAAGHQVKEPRDGDFDFAESGVIRVTTMHSAKGLDAPVVFLYLPTLPFVGVGLDEAAEDKMRRDLVYVAITRAMDHLDVLASSASKQQAIKDLVGLLDGGSKPR